MSKRLQRDAVVRKVYPAPEIPSYPSLKMTSKEIDDSSHRLSRVPQKYNTLKTLKQTGNDSFAASYFQDPEHIPDKRSPDEKLEEIEIRLEDNGIDDNDKFNLLIQKKSLTILAYGENSQQALEALTQLGQFYNEQSRPESALRNLKKALEISKSVNIDENASLSLAIEVAMAYLDSRSTSKAEQQSQILNAEKSIKPYRDTACDNQRLLYKRDLVFGRIYVSRKDYANAMNSFERSWEHLDAVNHGEASPEVATLYNEMGETAELMKDKDKAVEMFKMAYDTFMSLDMVDSAEMIAPKLAGKDSLPSKGISIKNLTGRLDAQLDSSCNTSSEVSMKSKSNDSISPRITKDDSAGGPAKVKSAALSDVMRKPNTEEDTEEIELNSD